jgi:hypothetical protein
VAPLLRIKAGGSRRSGPPGHLACLETMTTTRYPLDGKARTNIGKAMTDLPLTANRCGPRGRRTTARSRLSTMPNRTASRGRDRGPTRRGDCVPPVHHHRPSNLPCGGGHFRRTSRRHTLSNSSARPCNPENPARFAVRHYDIVVRISTRQRRSDSDHDRWTVEPHRLGPWRRR